MLIPSKLSRPVRLDHTVVRERLLAKLSGANNFRLALITSPAGYGKTTLISQWAAGLVISASRKLFAPESLASRRSRTTVWSSRTGRLSFDGISIVNHFTVENEEILFFLRFVINGYKVGQKPF
jgi:LuxR family maltose regulon positive regulatory protein